MLSPRFTPMGAARLSLAAAIVTLGIKFLAWGLTGSAGLLADAMETVVNLAAATMTLTLVAKALQPPDEKHPFGHHKAEYLASGAEGGLILLAAAAIAFAAVERLFNPQPLSRLGLGLAIAAVAAIINLITARLMMRTARAHESIALEADAKHLLTDVWSTAGVLAGVGLTAVAPSWLWLDPLIALGLAVHIGWAGWGLLRRSVDGLLDRALPPEEVTAVRQAICEVAGHDAAFHGLLTRVSGPRRFVAFHLLLPGDMTVAESHRLTDAMEAEIRKRLPRVQVTIHVEPREDCDSFDGEVVGGLASPAGEIPEEDCG